MVPHAHLFEQLLLKEDIANVKVCEGVVWVQFGCSLVVIHCTRNISHELVDDSPVGVQHSTGRDLDGNQISSMEWSQKGMEWKQMEWKCGMKFKPGQDRVVTDAAVWNGSGVETYPRCSSEYIHIPAMQC